MYTNTTTQQKKSNTSEREIYTLDRDIESLSQLLFGLFENEASGHKLQLRPTSFLTTPEHS